MPSIAPISPPRRLRWVARLRWVPAAVFLFAGAAKFGDPAAVAEFLNHFGVAARWLTPAALAVGSVEIGLGLFLAFGFRSAAVAGASLLVVYLALLAAAFASNDPPDCDCLGKLVAWEDRHRGIAFGMVRNALLTPLCLCGLIPRSIAR